MISCTEHKTREKHNFFCALQFGILPSAVYTFKNDIKLYYLCLGCHLATFPLQLQLLFGISQDFQLLLLLRDLNKIQKTLAVAFSVLIFSVLSFTAKEFFHFSILLGDLGDKKLYVFFQIATLPKEFFFLFSNIEYLLQSNTRYQKCLLCFFCTLFVNQIGYSRVGRTLLEHWLWFRFKLCKPTLEFKFRLKIFLSLKSACTNCEN